MFLFLKIKLSCQPKRH